MNGISLLRVASKLQSFECSHKLPHRWLPGCKEYEAAKAAIQARRRSALRLQIQTLARERWFLLALKSKYAGNILSLGECAFSN